MLPPFRIGVIVTVTLTVCGPAKAQAIAAAGSEVRVDKIAVDEKTFRYLLNDNAMASEKTAEGIRKFAADIVKLEKLVASKL